MIKTICMECKNDHSLICEDAIIVRTGENITTQLEIALDNELCNSWVYLDFKKANGETFKTPNLEICDNTIKYAIPLSVLDVKGKLKVEVVLQKESEEIWKSNSQTIYVRQSIDATEDIPNKADFITEAQELLDELSGAGGGGTNADWSQNDETQPDYVKNRTHCSYGKKYEDIVWDGDETGYFVTEPFEGFRMVKVSDLTPTIEELFGGTVFTSENLQTLITFDRILEAEASFFYGVDCDSSDGSSDLVYVILSPDDLCNEWGLPVGTLSAGVYFAMYGEKYATKLSFPEDVRKLDPKYIPPLPFLQIGNTILTEEQLKQLKRLIGIYD